MKRWLFNTASAISLLAFAASVMISIGQHLAEVSLLRAANGVRWELTSADGAVDLVRFAGCKPGCPFYVAIEAPDAGVRKRIAASRWGPLGVVKPVLHREWRNVNPARQPDPAGAE